MNFLAQAVWAALSAVLGGLIQKALVSLGIGAVTYAGVSTSLSFLKTQAVTAALGLGPEIVGLLSVLKVGSCVSIIFSATVAKMTLNGLNSDTVKRWVKK